MDAPFPTGMVQEIERFFKEVDPHLEPGRDFYEEVFQTQLFFPLQRKRELAEMMRLARIINPQVVMEIGADKGGGLYHWCKCLSSVEVVIACEIRGCPYQGAFAYAFPDITFAWMERASLPPPNLIKESIDVLFIDGDKLLMEQDFDAYLPLMNPNGLVFIHDVMDREPRKSYERIRQRGYTGHVIFSTADTDALMMELEANPKRSLTPHEEWLRHWNGRSCGVGVIYLGKEPVC